MNRLTSNDKDYIFASLNLFYVKDREVWLRGGGPEPNYDDTTLVELIRRASKTHNLNIEAEDAESLGDEMYDAMFDGVDTVEGIVALLHTAAIQAAEMRNRLEKLEAILGDEYDLDRLAAYEDTGLEPEEIAKIREDVETGYLKSTARRYGIPVDRLRELAKADREGRCVVLPCKPSDVTVYQLRNKKHARGVGISPRHVGSASVWGDGHYALHHQGLDDCLDRDLGKTWFLTEEDAEKALKGEGHETDPV